MGIASAVDLAAKNIEGQAFSNEPGPYLLWVAWTEAHCIQESELVSDGKLLISTRRFRDMGEVMQVPGYVPDNPVSKESYQCILGFYRFKEEVRCCRQNEAGNICREGHKFGYVVRLKDQSATIVGNDCATTKFGENSQIRSDASRMANEIERQTRVERFGELLGNREQVLADLSDAQCQVNAMQERIAKSLEALGPRIRLKLNDMSKSASGYVDVEGIRKRRVEIAGGVEVVTTKVPIRLGSILARQLLGENAFNQFLNARLRIVRAYTTASKLEGNPRSVQLRDLISVIADYPRVLASAKDLLDLESAFDKNDFALFCYLDDDKQERLKAAQFACGKLGIVPTREAAKQWLEEQDELRKRVANVDSIRAAASSLTRRRGFP